MKSLILVCALIYAVSGKPFNFTLKDDVTCAGYSACHPTYTDKINVHIVPHSHDDVGWLKTVNGYFTEDVESIIGTSLAGLSQNSDRRYIQVETAYFYMWLSKQTQETIDNVRNLVETGRLEIIGGGWSMNDEAAAFYQSTVDQFTLGLHYLVETLGKCARPRVGWQIDPFGHTREQASIFAQMGFDAFLMGRIDYRDKSRREKDKAMDLLWRGSANLGDDTVIFSSVLNHHYSTPGGFCWDKNCGDPVIVTDETSDEYNWEDRVNLFVERIQDYIDHYPTDNVLLPFGDDFQWSAAEKQFVNIDRLVAGFEKFKPKINGKDLNVIYSTPSCYSKAVHESVVAANLDLELKTDDFMPYADGANTVWSGFFTSRASSKRYERLGNVHNQMTKQLNALAGKEQGDNVKLERAMGVMQHHDAITGTEKQAVEKDYHKSLCEGIDISVRSNGDALSALIGLDGLELKTCPLGNTSICVETEGKTEANVLVYNPLGQKVTQWVQVAVSGGDWKVQDPEGNDVTSLVTVPARDYSYITEDIGGNLQDNIIIFKADLPALGYNQYKLYKDSKRALKPDFKPLQEVGDEQKIGFDDTYVIINNDNGLVSHMKMNGIEIEVKFELLYYKAPQSGAYIFRPDTNDRKALRITEKPTNKILNTEGDIVEFRQEFADWATFIIRIYKDADFIEVDWQVGPIDVGDGNSREIILRYSSTLASDSLVYTDSNGREMIQRKLDYRPDYEYTTEEPQAGNYYPVNSRIHLDDGTNQFGVIVDRSEGGASLSNGWIELMLHRGLLNDDGRGVGENLYEIEYNTGLVVRGSHYLTLNPKSSAAAAEKKLAQRVNLAPIPLFSDDALSTKSKSFIKQELPENVHLLTLQPWNETENTVLLRLEHLLEKDDDAELSKAVTVDVEDLFTTFTITGLAEKTLDGNMDLSSVSRWDWPQLSTKKPKKAPLKETLVELEPMQIRTFIATIERK